MPDEPSADIISGGRDPDRRRAAHWRPIAAVAAAALVGGGIAVDLLQGGSARTPHHAQGTPSAVALSAPSMLHGTPLRPGGAPSTALFLGGSELRILNGRGQVPTSLTAVPLGAAGAGNQLGPDPAVQQITSVAGGVAVLVFDHGAAGLPDVGDVLFVPAGASGAGSPRLLARANYMAVAPDHRSMWIEQAGPPWGNGPAANPTWLVDEHGHRLSVARGLQGRSLVAATARGLLVRGADQKLALINPADGQPVRTAIPANAVIAGAGANDVAWQPASCGPRCPLHVTDVRGGPDLEIALPPRTVINSNDTSDFDPAGQRFALALDTINPQGADTGTNVYVADFSGPTLSNLPGGRIPLAALPAVPGAFPAGSTDVVSARWAVGSSGLWIVATDGLYFQAAYWTGHGPLRVLPPLPGLAYKFAVPGTGPPGP